MSTKCFLVAFIALSLLFILNLAGTKDLKKETKAIRIAHGALTIEVSALTNTVDTLSKRLDALNAVAIKKNDYNAQTCITITPDGSEYIPIIVKDEAYKARKKKKGELEDWDKRTQWLDLSSLYRKIEKEEDHGKEK